MMFTSLHLPLSLFDFHVKWCNVPWISLRDWWHTKIDTQREYLLRSSHRVIKLLKHFSLMPSFAFSFLPLSLSPSSFLFFISGRINESFTKTYFFYFLSLTISRLFLLPSCVCGHHSLTLLITCHFPLSSSHQAASVKRFHSAFGCFILSFSLRFRFTLCKVNLIMGLPGMWSCFCYSWSLLSFPPPVSASQFYCGYFLSR